MQSMKIPLNKLTRAFANARKIAGKDEALAHLKGVIKSHGFFGGLIVQPGTKDTYQVVAGERRRQALAELAKEGALEPDMLIPCDVLEEGDADPTEVSLGENLARVELHPSDQIAAWGVLHNKGKGLSIEQIADRFSYSPRMVEQRVRLAEVHPDLLALYRDQKISMDTLTAFCLVSDQKKQLKAYETAKKQNTWNDTVTAHTVSQLLAEGKLNSNNPITKYVGLKKYEAKGGTVTRDLFSDVDDKGMYFDNPGLIRELAVEMLDKYVKNTVIKKEGWKWAEIELDDAYNAARAYDKLKSEDYDSEAEKEVYSEKQRAVSGVIVSIDYAGKIGRDQGLVKEEDVEAARATVETEEGEDETGGGLRHKSTAAKPTVDKQKKAQKEAQKEAGLSNTLADDLRMIRMNLVRSSLVEHPDLCFDLLTFQMAGQLLHYTYRDRLMDVTPHSVSLVPSGKSKEFEADNPGGVAFQLIVDEIKEKHSAWLGDNFDVSPAEKWALFQALPEAEKNHIFAVCTTYTLRQQLSIDTSKMPELENVIRQINPDFTRYRPTADIFWSRLAKPALLDILEGISGDLAEQYKGAKKGELAEAMGRLFANPTAEEFKLSTEAQERVENWVPDSFVAQD